MIVLPRRGRLKRFGIRWRWTLAVATMRDIDDLVQGTRREARRAYGRIVQVSLMARIMCADKIATDFTKHIQNCLVEKDRAQSKPSADTQQLLVRHSMEVCRTTGLTPAEQYSQLSYREFEALITHCYWAQSVEHKYYAAQVGDAGILDYPFRRSTEENQDDEQERLKQLLMAWTPKTPPN